MSPHRTSPSRRTLLGLGLGAGVAAAAGARLPSPARADVPDSPRFVLDATAHDWYDTQSHLLHESHHAQQGMTYDQQNQRLFISQIQNGSSGDDLCINQVDRSGKVQGWMRVPDAGHGVSIGVESVGADSYIWMEADSSDPGNSGRGTALQRFRFVDGTEPSDAEKFLTGSDNVTCATDPVNDRMVVRRWIDGRANFSTHRMVDAAQGDFSQPLSRCLMPTGIPGPGQGYAFLGRYLYHYSGSGHEDPADIDSAITCIDLNTGEIVAGPVTVTAGSDLMFREPEALAVCEQDGQPRLLFGFCSHDPEGSIDRFSNVFYLDTVE